MVVFIPIAPLSLLHTISHRTMYLTVAPWFDYQEYYDFFKQRGDRYIILDNGTFEGDPRSDLIELAKDINAREIVLPDDVGNFQSSTFKQLQFLSTLSNNEKARFRFMIPFHGDDIDVENFIQTFREELDTFVIGLPAVRKDDKPRVYFASLFSRFNLPIHMLGLQRCDEIAMFPLFPNIRSFDTSMPFKLAQNFTFFSPQDHSDHGRLKFDVPFEYWKSREKIAKVNVRLMDEFVHAIQH